MPANRTLMKARMTQLKQLLHEIPENLVGFPDPIRHIVRTAPQLLADIETTLERQDPDALELLNQPLKQAETLIKWAVGTIKGEALADAIKKGKQPSACQPVHERSNFRMMQFMVGYLNEAVYVRLVKEFCGDDAVQGKTIIMDPVGESDAFANWLVFDKVLPGQPKRLIDLFADQFFDLLPVDEQALLTARVNDQPSIYRVFKLQLDPQTGKRSSVYRIRDLLAPDKDALTINDRATSQTLKRDSIFRPRHSGRRRRGYLFLAGRDYGTPRTALGARFRTAHCVVEGLRRC